MSGSYNIAFMYTQLARILKQLNVFGLVVGYNHHIVGIVLLSQLFEQFSIL